MSTILFVAEYFATFEKTIIFDIRSPPRRRIKVYRKLFWENILLQ
jgi:hypothetical protein